MRTACSSTVWGGVSVTETLLDRDPWTDTPRERPPRTETLLDREPPLDREPTPCELNHRHM